jgi:hypothetical protein
MVRAVLNGFRLVAMRSYATHVSTDMDEAIGWLLTRLPKPDSRAPHVGMAREEITRRRRDAEAKGA